MLGGRQTLDDCERGGWITPVFRGPGRTLFRLADLHQCADRIERGEYPLDK